MMVLGLFDISKLEQLRSWNNSTKSDWIRLKKNGNAAHEADKHLSFAKPIGKLQYIAARKKKEKEKKEKKRKEKKRNRADT